ncbi:alpha/beta hydrolase [Intestinibacillus massiliensis]|nr:alpha/beta hydrolase [Intestinibacillus massiliensis]
MFDAPAFAHCNGIKIAYYEYGAGEPLVLLHGNGEDSTYFAHQVEAFSGEYRIIAVDSRGHGRSETGARGLFFGLFTEDLRALLDTLGIAKAHILGFSDGGNLALLFALRYPSYVGRLILNGANINMLAVKPSVQLPVISGYALLRLFGCFSAQARRKRDVLGLMVHGYGVTFADLRRIAAPTLVIAGERDMILEPHTRRIAQAIPHARLCLLPGGDHFCAAKRPEAFNAAVREFLQNPTGKP